MKKQELLGQKSRKDDAARMVFFSILKGVSRISCQPIEIEEEE